MIRRVNHATERHVFPNFTRTNAGEEAMQARKQCRRGGNAGDRISNELKYFKEKHSREKFHKISTLSLCYKL